MVGYTLQELVISFFIHLLVTSIFERIHLLLDSLT